MPADSSPLHRAPTSLADALAILSAQLRDDERGQGTAAKADDKAAAKPAVAGEGGASSAARKGVGGRYDGMSS